MERMNPITIFEGRGDFQSQITRLEKFLLSLPDESDAFQTRHYFAPGIYCRELTIPAGAVLTGKIHRTAHINIVSKGKILVRTEEGCMRIEAPYAFVAQPGTKRAGLAIEETIWTTVHASEETDLDKLEAELIAPTFDAYRAQLENF